MGTVVELLAELEEAVDGREGWRMENHTTSEGIAPIARRGTSTEKVAANIFVDPDSGHWGWDARVAVVGPSGYHGRTRSSTASLRARDAIAAADAAIEDMAAELAAETRNQRAEADR